MQIQNDKPLPNVEQSSRAVFQSTDWILYPCLPGGTKSTKVDSERDDSPNKSNCKCGSVIKSPEVLLHCLFFIWKEIFSRVVVIPDCLLPADHNVFLSCFKMDKPN